jgi:hypothetical protein
MEAPAECYGLVAQEMPEPMFGELESPESVLADLDQEYVERARAFAEERHLPWPPAPAYDWAVHVL